MSAVRHTPEHRLARLGVPLGLLAASAAGLGGASCSFDGASQLAADPSRGFADADEPPVDAADDRGEPDAAPPEPDAALPPAGLRAPFTGTPPIADGDVEDLWSAAPPLVFALGDAELDIDTSPSYTPSATVTVRALHDDSRLYLLYEVVDDVVYSDASTLRHDDGVGLFLDGAGDRSGPIGDDDHAVIISAGASYYDYSGNDITLGGTIVETADGYRGEITLEKIGNGGIGGVGGSGTLGFNLALIDNDDVGNGNREAFGLWRAPQGPHCDDCCEGEPMPWCDTTMLDTLVLEAP